VSVRPAAALALLSAAAAFVSGCHRDGCVGGDDGTCLPPSACAALDYTSSCGSAPVLAVSVLDGASGLTGPKARGVPGDILLENDRVRVVLSAPPHPSDLAPTGGAIIDFGLASDSGDQINSIYQAAGLLPRDAVHYDSYHTEHDGEGTASGSVSVVFRGHLEGDSRVTVVTRYELRACEPGVRVRSDLYNGARDPNTLYLADGSFWGDNAAAPFVPGVGLGFRAPALDLKDVASAWREWPFVAARTQAPPWVSYAIVPCDRTQAAGFNDPTLTASGLPLVTTLPGDGIHLERFILAAPGPGLAPAVGEALRARSMVHREPAPVPVSGRVVAGGTPIDGRLGRAASLIFYEPAFGPDPDDPARRKPWSEAVPGDDGHFTVALPADRTYRMQPYAFGLPAGPATSFIVGRDAGVDDAGNPGVVDVGDVTMTASAHLLATVATAPGQQIVDPTTFAELVLVPVNPPPAGAEPPSLYGLFAGCNPMLGPPHGGSPACNRAIAADGQFDLLIPAGQYYVYATRGPFATLDRAQITVGPGDEARIGLVVQPLAVLPAGVFSGDFHVHGAASFDSSTPDQDRVLSFLSSGVNLVVATDHNVVTSYQDALDAVGGTDRLVIISGTEQTPNIPWFNVPGEELPKTLGHFNFWPLAVDATLPRNGAPWAELREPGQMMDDIEPLFVSAGVRQLNHPFADGKLERDQGFLRAIGYDPRTPIATGSSFATDVLMRTPGGAGQRCTTYPGGALMPAPGQTDGPHCNLDWDVQEVMTGASPTSWLHERALWFSMLSQGFFRAGTANSDTHSLSLEQAGYPRNLVFDYAMPPPTSIDVARFDDNVRQGHMVGTTGPVIIATIDDGMGVGNRKPGGQPFAVARSAGTLNFEVDAAPWIPVTEIRVIVNGQVVTTVANPDEFASNDHFGTTIAKRTGSFALSSLLENVRGDAWLIVEAGLALTTPVDTDGDGLPDLADSDLRGLSKPSVADYEAIVPGGWSVAFTNPFLLNVDGGSWQPPGLP
jgi:hypothetical protein